MKLFTLLTLLPLLGLSQKFVTVNNMDINTPIPFASVIYNHNQGTYANEEGTFYLPEKAGDSLIVSAMGYTTLTIATKSVQNIIQLQPNVVSLDEVVLTHKKPKTKEISVRRINNMFPSHMLGGYNSIGSIITPKKSSLQNSTTFVEALTLYFAKVNEKHTIKDSLEYIKTVVRINCYTVKDSLPDTHIYQSNPIYINSYKQDQLDLNLEDSFIPFTETGLAIEIETLGLYNLKTKQFLETQELLLRPQLSENKSKDLKCNSYYKRINYNNSKSYEYVDMNNFINKYLPYGIDPVDKTLAFKIVLKTY